MSASIRIKGLTRNLTVICAALFVTHPAWGAGGNAGGYQGPSLHPTSIAVDLEHGILLSNVEAAIRVCLIEGDTKSGLVSLVERTTSGFRKAPYTDFNVFSRPEEKTSQPMVPVVFGVLYKDDRQFYRSELTASIAWDKGLQRPNLSLHVHGDTFSLRFPRSAELSTSSGFPTVTYESSVAAHTYDPTFKNLVKENWLLKNLKIWLPAGYGPAVPLLNDETKQVVEKITVNMVEYVECLQGELAARAE